MTTLIDINFFSNGHMNRWTKEVFKKPINAAIKKTKQTSGEEAEKSVFLFFLLYKKYLP
jgi:hypothetical protein